MQSRSLYKALSADAPAKEGLNAHAVLIDELHAQKTRELWDILRYSGASRRQPLHLSITTAGYDRHSICWEQHDYAEKVLEGVIEDPAFFAFISAAGEEADWTDPRVSCCVTKGFRPWRHISHPPDALAVQGLARILQEPPGRHRRARSMECYSFGDGAFRPQ